MNDIFKKRMEVKLGAQGNVGRMIVNNSNAIENKTFKNDANYEIGKLYDWEGNFLEDVDFKLEKHKVFAPDEYEIEYQVRFRPNYNPEHKFKDLHFKHDGKERLGFYLDIYDFSKERYERWMIVAKDDRIAFDRYLAYKCNWCLEWVHNGEYKKAIVVLRDASGKKYGIKPKSDTLGGSTIDGDISIYVPTSESAISITLGTRFIITDDTENPQAYEVFKIKDTTPIGLTKLFIGQSMFNSHTDYLGFINEEVDLKKFVFPTPVDDLDSAFGGRYHMIADALRSDIKQIPDMSEELELRCAEKCIYVNGSVVEIKAMSKIMPISTIVNWHFFIDNVEYSIEELKEYFEISINDNVVCIKAINKVMAKYIVKVAIYDDVRSYYDSVELEVKI